MKKLLIGTVVLLLSAVLVVVFGFYLSQRQMFHSPVLDTVAPTLPAKLAGPALLIFSKTNGFRHEDGIAAAQKTIASLAAKNGWSVFTTENGAIHNPEQLARFSVVIWANASGQVLNNEQQSALRSYIENGGGFLGLHAAGDGSHKHWSWYQDVVLRADFIGHTLFPHLQDAAIDTVSQEHPVVAGLPDRWNHNEEWYAFESSPAARGSIVLLAVDESSYKPGKFAMPKEHAVAWAHEVDKGRVVYSALGHTARSFETPEHQQMLKQAIQWLGRFPAK